MNISWRLLQQLAVIDQPPPHFTNVLGVPGITTNQLARRSGQTTKTIRYYLQELQTRGLVSEQFSGQKIFYTTTLLGLRAAKTFRQLCQDLDENPQGVDVSTTP